MHVGRNVTDQPHAHHARNLAVLNVNTPVVLPYVQMSVHPVWSLVLGIVNIADVVHYPVGLRVIDYHVTNDAPKHYLVVINALLFVARPVLLSTSVVNVESTGTRWLI